MRKTTQDCAFNPVHQPENAMTAGQGISNPDAPEWRALCAPADIPPGGTRAFPAENGCAYGLFAVHHHRDGILLYVNACPHLGVPLDWLPDQFLTLDGTRIICATHGAEFRISDGYCVKGPCRGESLTKVPSTVVNNVIMVRTDAGRNARENEAEKEAGG